MSYFFLRSVYRPILMTCIYYAGHSWVREHTIDWHIKTRISRDISRFIHGWRAYSTFVVYDQTIYKTNVSHSGQ